VDGFTIVLTACSLILGFLIGWLLEWRMDAVYWSRHVAQSGKREKTRRTQAEEEMISAQLQADQHLAELQRQFEAQLAEVRAQANEQIAAAYARAETLMIALKSEQKSRDMAHLKEYEQNLSEIRARREVQLPIGLMA
jgi:hypothetical protein